MPMLHSMTTTVSVEAITNDLTLLAATLDSLQKKLVDLKINLTMLKREILYKNTALLVKRYKDENKKVILVLGARPNEEKHFNFTSFNNGIGIIYLDELHQGTSSDTFESDPLFIQGSFNDLTLLTKLTEELADSFDLIIPDFSVGKFMKFSVAHLNCFFALLTNNGKMLFDYKEGLMPVINGLNKTDAEIMQEATAFNLNFEHKDLEAEQILLKSRQFYIHPHDTINQSPISKAISDEIKNNYTDFIGHFTTRFIADRSNISFNFIENARFPYWNSLRPTRRNPNFKFKDISKKTSYFVMEKI